MHSSFTFLRLCLALDDVRVDHSGLQVSALFGRGDETRDSRGELGVPEGYVEGHGDQFKDRILLGTWGKSMEKRMWSRTSPHPPFLMCGLCSTVSALLSARDGGKRPSLAAARSSSAFCDAHSGLQFSFWWRPQSPVWRTLEPFAARTLMGFDMQVPERCCRVQSQL
ncbi:hypothetical protein EYF80_004645 [Liparis tanakae]|uniref:Uncharacterized protein n=1 Tax=Liparis tanakae TaxID=230148 RepID=A0A4Z2J4X0_9TELE|nr:hypothetical protein EYF80_004645 [Liparis tanakae]